MNDSLSLLLMNQLPPPLNLTPLTSSSPRSPSKTISMMTLSSASREAEPASSPLPNSNPNPKLMFCEIRRDHLFFYFDPHQWMDARLVSKELKEELMVDEEQSHGFDRIKMDDPDFGHNNLYTYTRRQRGASSSFNNSHSALTADQVIDPREIDGSSQQALTGKTVEACDQPKLIENIDGILSPEEFTQFLFHGHEKEHTARDLLSADIGRDLIPQGKHKDDGPLHLSSAEDPQAINLKVYCLYCHCNMIYDTAPCHRRPCGHYFHRHCFRALPLPVQVGHIQCRECYFCILKKPKN